MRSSCSRARNTSSSTPPSLTSATRRNHTRRFAPRHAYAIGLAAIFPGCGIIRKLMTVKRIVVCEAQVPFVHGGAEVHVRELTRELKARGFEAELVSVPFKWYPKEEILPHAAAWRLLDLSESNGRPVDLVIGTKFPSYFARHPNKVAWLIHQYRAAYELCGTPYSDFAHTELDVGLRDTLTRLDSQMLGECRALFANARNTAARLAKFNGLAAEPLYHPPKLARRLVPGPYT